MNNRLINAFASWQGAVMFYTCLPVRGPVAFQSVARWAPWVGTVIGGFMAIADHLLGLLQVPLLLASALVVALGIALTGGLHVDGVMDVADGLAVPDRSRRLAVMADSRMGAFGGMAAVVLILLKVLALAAIENDRFWVLIAVAMWGRWAQQWAIACYPYLKKEGKGAFHQAALPTVWHTLPGLLGLIAIGGLLAWAGVISTALSGRIAVGGVLVAMLTSAYFYRQLGGHTGDTYGAVVEWSEALLLCSLSIHWPAS
ncbi:MAG: adenosylcobinamide-GDP ribazoletransferase [Cyanobacteria bacterium J06634_6]